MARSYRFATIVGIILHDAHVKMPSITVALLRSTQSRIDEHIWHADASVDVAATSQE